MRKLKFKADHGAKQDDDISQQRQLGEIAPKDKMSVESEARGQSWGCAGWQQGGSCAFQNGVPSRAQPSTCLC